MAKMPDFEKDIKRDLGIAEHAIGSWFHRQHAAQTPAPMPATMAAAAAAPKENPMSLAKLDDDIKEDLTEGLTYVEGLVGRLKAAAPGVIATGEAVSGSTVGKLVEAVAGRVLPAPLEDALSSIVKDFVDRYAPAAAATPAPAAPAALAATATAAAAPVAQPAAG